MKLALFSPWPPQPSGIAGRSAELAAALAARGHGIDVFVDEREPSLAPVLRRAPDAAPAAGSVRVQSAHDYVWRAAARQYDVPIYQIGNSQLHEYIWPYLFQWPGLVLLHDARLHHARGRALLRRRREDAYRAEFAWNQHSVSPDLAELAVRGFDGPYYYQWPMIRAVVENARLIASHSRSVTEALRAEFPDRPVEYVPLGEGPMDPDVASAGRRFRIEHGIGEPTILFGVHGGLTAAKRLSQVLRAFAAVRQSAEGTRLLLAGRPDPALAVEQEIAALGLQDVTVLVKDLDDAGFDAAIAACDVTINLRWPTALETSGPWVRSLALGRPTVIFDLAHHGDVPTLDPRTWRRHAPCSDASPDADARSVAVAIDILDEDHSLRLALAGLAADEPLRRQLGLNARAYWEREHTVERMVDAVEAAAARAASLPAPAVNLPQHLRADPEALAKALIASVQGHHADPAER
jgi:glycosyltransferase involved in cell wall biosynthesis